MRLAAGAAVAVVVALASSVLLPGNAVAAQMDQLAAHAAGPLPPRTYLYTETRTLTIGGTARPGPTDRRWDSWTSTAWQGDTCNDRVDTVQAPTRFFSPADEQAFRAEAGEQALRTALRGWSTSDRGAALRPLDAVPCEGDGTFSNPNPAYAATYPSTPEGFLSKAVRDAGAHPDRAFNTPADAVLDMLRLPYLTAAQRSAALRAFGQAAGEWTVGEHVTVAGVRGVTIRRDLGPVEEELVIGAQAPGLLRSVLRITDPAHAGAFDPRYVGLSEGTVVRDEVVLTVAVVPDLDSRRQTGQAASR
ncbi:hypothetical protein [Kineosporia sp. A_224]|uniref:hypothetical protein n=1 Tax=Kineosporia sp. A_224 TaxID=1962180 RepID=UPI0018E986F8|nr:hypothetical protein [Kineosporia sp. A_224]